MPTCVNCKIKFTIKYGTALYCSRSCYLDAMSKTPKNSPLFKSWDGARYRCNFPTSKDYARYGGRGITFSGWKNFAAFEKWAYENGFKIGLTLERRNNSKGYHPSNCYWASYKAQARNRRNNTLLTAFGETKTMVEWSEDPRCSVKYATLIARITKQGLPHELAITHPRQPRNKGGKRDRIIVR